MKLFSFAFMTLLICIQLAACGPVRAQKMVWDVEDELAKAEKAKAYKKQNAIYYYWAAKAYLEKAKEEMSYSDFDPAGAYDDPQEKYNFGQKALDLARTSYKNAKGSQSEIDFGRDIFEPGSETSKKDTPKIKKKSAKGDDDDDDNSDSDDELFE